MACGPVNFGGRTVAQPCPGWLGCTSEDYAAVRQALALEHNALVRSLNAFNAVIGDKTTAARWSLPGKGYQGQVTPAGIITWDTPTNAAYAVYQESLAALEKYGESVFLPFQSEGPISTLLQLAMSTHAATCDVDEALLDAGVVLPQKPEQPQPEKTVAREALDFIRESATSLGVFVAATIVAIFGYNYVTRKGKNRW